MKYSVENNRLVAFIYIEGEFFTHKFHTECVTDYLKYKNKIKEDKDLYSMLNSKSKEHIARKWIEQIEEHCIFGELANYKNEVAIIVFNDLTELGIKSIKEKGLLAFGTSKVIYAEYVNFQSQKFIFKEL